MHALQLVLHTFALFDAEYVDCKPFCQQHSLLGHITDQGLNKLLHNNVIYVLHLQAIPKQ